jgi:hypothetical protein
MFACGLARVGEQMGVNQTKVRPLGRPAFFVSFNTQLLRLMAHLYGALATIDFVQAAARP